jgi:ferredoxin-NADP reductase
MIHLKTRVVDIINRAPGVKSFRFGVNGELNFKPGQFFFITLEIDGNERTKHFSFSNSPTEKGYVEFTKRITQSPFSGTLDRLKKGDPAELKMPYGSFTFEGEYEKVAFLSGGIGITPIRSMLKFATDKVLATDFVLLYGNSREEDIIFKEDLDRMQSVNKNLRVVYTLTSREADKSEWNGRTGHIDSSAIKEELPDYKDRVFYICGPPAMVSSLAAILKNELGVKDTKIKIENFTGY